MYLGEEIQPHKPARAGLLRDLRNRGARLVIEVLATGRPEQRENLLVADLAQCIRNHGDFAPRRARPERLERTEKQPAHCRRAAISSNNARACLRRSFCSSRTKKRPGSRHIPHPGLLRQQRQELFL
jgi:hypothetical protein